MVSQAIELVDVSDKGLGFRCDGDFEVGETLLVTDGVDVAEVAVRNTRKSKKGPVFGVELKRSAELPIQFVREAQETYLRLAEQMDLESKRTRTS